MQEGTSIKKNTVFNIVKSLSSVAFPLITFPYISRVLGTENIGKINFTNSIINYFILIATLGITSYAIRECAKVREDKNELQRVASQIYSINMCSTLLSFFVLTLFLIFAEPIRDYRTLLLIQSITVLFNTLGTDWLNSAMEDFKYLTIRTVLFQILSIVLMFLFVKESSHYYRYVVIMVLSASGGNMMNIFYRKKYCHISFTFRMNVRKHLKPIFLMFSIILSQTLYSNSGTTILGLFKGDYQVGLYSVATRIYTIVNTMVASVAYVVMPQMAYLFASKNYNKINKLFRYATDCIVVVGFPILVGIIAIAPEVVEIISGPQYLKSVPALRILMISLFFSFVGGIISNVLLIPSGREKVCMLSSVVCALVNISINFVLIPRFGLYAAAMTTALTECIGLIIVSRKVERAIKIGKLSKICSGPLIGCLAIIGINIIIKRFSFELWIRTGLIVTASVLIYVAILYITRNEFTLDIMNSFIKRLKNQKEV